MWYMQIKKAEWNLLSRESQISFVCMYPNDFNACISFSSASLQWRHNDHDYAEQRILWFEWDSFFLLGKLSSLHIAFLICITVKS